MIEKIKKYQRPLLIGLIVICMGIMALGAVIYLERIVEKLDSLFLRAGSCAFVMCNPVMGVIDGFLLLVE